MFAAPCFKQVLHSSICFSSAKITKRIFKIHGVLLLHLALPKLNSATEWLGDNKFILDNN